MIDFLELPSAEGSPELWVLPGWGVNPEIMMPWLESLQSLFKIRLLRLPMQTVLPEGFSVESYLQQLAEHIKQPTILLGWSLGGNLAIEFAARFPKKTRAVFTIATNPKFCQAPGWPNAMAVDVFDKFYQQASDNIEQTIKQFHLLCAQGDPLRKQQLTVLKQNQQSLAAKSALFWLNSLAAFDQREILPNLSCPVMTVFAEHDALVPANLASDLPNAVVVKNAGHMPFLSAAEQCSTYLIRFLQNNGMLEQRDKQSVAQSFSRAAKTYDEAAELQLQVADNLLVKFQQADQGSEGLLLDLGCGNGRVSFALQGLQHSKTVIGLDLAEGMLQEAQLRLDMPLLAGDAEQLPLLSDSVDGVFSSLVIQWCENIESLFAELFRVMKPGSVACLSTLGPASLWQLRKAWASIDFYEHVNRFYPLPILVEAASRAGFAVDVEEEQLDYFFTDLPSLMRSLKEIGAQNQNQYRQSGLTGKSKFKQLAEVYEQYRCADGLPASYQVFYLCLQKK